MSRVDEALKRASRGSRTDLPERTSGPVRALAGEAALERYPAEARAGLASRTPLPASVSGGAARQGLDPRPALENVRVAAPPVPAAPAVPVPTRPGTADRKLPVFAPAFDGKLVVTADASPAAIQQYDRLAKRLIQSQVERGTRTVMVASALPSEGRTLTAANLALALSERHQKQVLLVDADLASPSIHTIFRVSNALGLGESLRLGRAQMPAVDVSTKLTVLPAGAADADPMEILVSNPMRDFLRDARPHFDFIVLDTPPLSTLTDAHLLAWLVDAVVLVVQARTTPRKAVERAIEDLGADRVLGTVFNRAGGRAKPPKVRQASPGGSTGGSRPQRTLLAD